ncbi:hypothetical protein ACKLNO_00240 [Neisseriaceae bacterium B1]
MDWWTVSTLLSGSLSAYDETTAILPPFSLAGEGTDCWLKNVSRIFQAA